MNRNSQKKVHLNKFISHFFRVKSHHTFEVINITLFGAPKACTSINSLYNTSCFLFFLRQKPLKIKAHQLMWELFGPQVVGVLSLQQWQSYLGLILVEKEETLAASCRLHSTFVSKIHQDRDGEKRGVGKAEGEDEC